MEAACRPRGLIEIRAMDRETARKNMTTGLVAGDLIAAIPDVLASPGS